MKVLFVIDSIDFADHIAISYLSAIAKQLNHKTYICILKDNSLLSMVNKVKPEVVAYSVNLMGYKNIIKQHKLAKQKYNFISIMGGPQATFSPETFSESGMDAYCIGEGEFAFRDFLIKIMNKESFDGVLNLITKTNINPLRSLIKNIDEIPLSDRDLTISNSYLRNVPKKTFYATRGCPYKCHYCLAGDTVISTSKGKNKKIKDINKGDKVISFDETKKELVENEVIDIFCREVEELLEVKTSENTKIMITSNHDIYTPNGWIKSGDLTVGDKILLIDYKDKISFNKKMYNPAKREEVKKKISNTMSLQRERLSERLKKAWREGRITAHPTSEENRHKSSIRMKANNPMKNKEVSEKVRNTLIEKYKKIPHPNRGRKRPDVAKRMCENNPMKDETIANNPDRIRKMSLSLGGTGIPYEFRCHPKEFSNKLKEKVRSRDLYICQLCGCGGGKRKLVVHHIDSNKNNNEMCNLISLCTSCHGKVKANKEYWKRLFQEKMLVYSNCPHFVEVASIHIIKKKRKVYNFECVPNNNYFANYMLVHNCCNNYYHKIYKGKGSLVRRFSVERIICEIERVKSKYRTDFIKFGDDIFATSASSWMEEFSKQYSKRIKIPFNCFLRFDTVKDDLLQLLKEAGCHSVHLSVDSTSDYVREEILNRKMKKVNIEQSIRRISDYGIKTWVNYMLAVPCSTLEDDINTIFMSKKANVTYPHYTTTIPMRGTKLYDYCLEKNLIDSNYNSDMSGFSKKSELKCFTKKEKEIRYNIYLLGALISKLPFPLDKISIILIKTIPPNRIFLWLRKIFFDYNIKYVIFNLRVKK